MPPSIPCPCAQEVMAEVLAKMEPLNIISAPAQTIALAPLLRAAESPDAAEEVFAAMCQSVGAFPTTTVCRRPYRVVSAVLSSIPDAHAACRMQSMLELGASARPCSLSLNSGVGRMASLRTSLAVIARLRC